MILNFLKVVSENDLAAVKMEVVKVLNKKRLFREIRKICTEKNIILIFDECTSGFLETYGGIHKKLMYH